MTLLKNNWFLGFALVFFAMSCSKENISTSGMEVETPPEVVVNEVEVVETTVLELWEGSLYLECYSLVFPVEVILVDGTTVVLEGHEELCDLIEEEQVQGYTFPLTVADSEGNEIVFENQEDVETALEDCPEDPGDGVNESMQLLLELLAAPIFVDCYTINYPIVMTLEGEATVTVNSDEELENAFVENTEYVTGMELPASITMVADGSIVALNSVEDQFAVVDSCN